MQRYMMTYTALSSRGPRIDLAASKDLFHWQRLGLATLLRAGGCSFVYKEPRKPSQLYEKKLSLRPSRRSLCSFRQTRFLYSTNCAWPMSLMRTIIEGMLASAC